MAAGGPCSGVPLLHLALHRLLGVHEPLVALDEVPRELAKVLLAHEATRKSRPAPVEAVPARLVHDEGGGDPRRLADDLQGVVAEKVFAAKGNHTKAAGGERDGRLLDPAAEAGDSALDWGQECTDARFGFSISRLRSTSCVFGAASTANRAFLALRFFGLSLTGLANGASASASASDAAAGSRSRRQNGDRGSRLLAEKVVWRALMVLWEPHRPVAPVLVAGRLLADETRVAGAVAWRTRRGHCVGLDHVVDCLLVVSVLDECEHLGGLAFCLAGSSKIG